VAARWSVCIGVALLCLLGCAEEASVAETKQGGKAMAITVTSTAFAQGKPIPKRHTGEGEDLSPALAWMGVPEGTKEIVLICDDPDAPTAEPWVHWVIYRIPPTATGLPEAVPKQEKLPDGSKQGKNSWPRLGYNGPMPPPGHGTHRYFFKVYALDALTDLEPGATKRDVLKAIDGHIVAEGELMGTYER